ncbi:MAG TPA: hypothetical protein VLU43_15105 [Anaeromyxobacteraceae bacterium]|nr:hypothetical protein [Anaeromyxobacteraceae bacterium]
MGFVRFVVIIVEWFYRLGRAVFPPPAARFEPVAIPPPASARAYPPTRRGRGSW